MSVNKNLDKAIKKLSKELNERGWSGPKRDFVSDKKAGELIELITDILLDVVEEGPITITGRLKIKKIRYRNGKHYIEVKDIRKVPAVKSDRGGQGDQGDQSDQGDRNDRR